MVHYHFTWLFKTCTVGARDVLPINCFSSFWITYLRRKCQGVFKGPWHGHPTISSFQWKLGVKGLLYLERYERLAVKDYFSAKQPLEVSGWKSHPLAVTAIQPWLQWHHVSKEWCCHLLQQFQPLQIVQFHCQTKGSLNISISCTADHRTISSAGMQTLSQPVACYVTARKCGSTAWLSGSSHACKNIQLFIKCLTKCTEILPAYLWMLKD